eukprot:TRINITY_DN7119_c0_g1_i1.p1 TRINITY_DN7119_c0_g1~~TRINITY_DN7119_c0_g1_i1.p1  ORF type:complete len:537 (+),score=88.46 TRINITY_DN7119_c0_g1_i1:314-1924(+)
MGPKRSPSPVVYYSTSPFSVAASPERNRANSMPVRIQSGGVEQRKSTGIEAFVHIDFKGAPPKMDYLKSLLPCMKSWGATGLLLEWEDMLPYRGQFEVLRSKNHYKEEEVLSLLESARELQLRVIPLIQTFGHLEFMLKHPEFSELRELKDDFSSLCPLHSDSGAVIRELVDEVLFFHEGCDTIHIGADEVWTLGRCHRCSFFTETKSREDLFLHHAEAILDHVRGRGFRAWLWDDMMRSWPIAALQRIQQRGGVPVVWSYQENPEAIFPVDMWTRYEAVFPYICAATAYKGATEPHTTYVPILKHVKNHAQWVDRLRMTRSIGTVVLTGWSRFDHAATLCELFPASIPSLALCLTFLHRSFNTPHFDPRSSRNAGARAISELAIRPLIHPEAHCASELAGLGLDGLELDLQKLLAGSLDVPPPALTIPIGKYPGADVLSMVGKFEWAVVLLSRAVQWRCHFVPFQPRHGNRHNPSKIKLIRNYAEKAHELLVQLRDHLPMSLSSYLYEDDVQEFLQDKVLTALKTVEMILKDVDE